MSDCWPCTSGYFCANPGQSSASAFCNQGFYCPGSANVTVPDPLEFICPAGQSLLLSCLYFHIYSLIYCHYTFLIELLSIPHSTLHTTHSILHTPHSTFHTPYYTLHTPYYTLHTPHSTLHTPYSTLHTPYSICYVLLPSIGISPS